MSEKRKRILIVDDSRFSRWTLTQELTKHGAEAIEAPNAIEALRMIESERPDAVILDLLMPDMNGLELLARLNGSPGVHPPVIILTADIQKSTYERCIELGAAGFLKKPVNSEDLASTLEGVLNGSKTDR